MSLGGAALSQLSELAAELLAQPSWSSEASLGERLLVYLEDGPSPQHSPGSWE